ncbi:MAG: thiol:disulfide interchange protein DsbA/DsbL [Proteobacteria bacterium]|nr:thiol:disulfide interchange protein DsbA/DsbL [Pseudomonadota bacterium]
MTRTPSLPIVLTLCAAALLALSACSHRTQAPQPSSQAAAQTGQRTAPPSAAGQQSADDQTASGQTAGQGDSGSTSTAQTGADSSPSLAHLAALPASAALPSSSEWKAGVNYDVVTPAQPTTVAPGKVEVMEVFWLACPHCYALEPFIKAWRKTKPSYVKFVRVPVMWGPVQRAHARFYYTLESVGRADLVDKAFAYIHDLDTQSGTESGLVSNTKQQSFKVQEAWAVQHGVTASAFTQAYDSFFVNTQLQQAQQTMNAYQVQAVPFIAVDGKFTTNVEQAGSPNKLISLINFLAAWEHDHKH